MLQKTNQKITRYEYFNGEAIYYLDIVENPNNGNIEAILSRQGYAFWTYMWGSVVKTKEAKAEYMELIEANLDEYIEYYEEDMEEDEELFWAELEAKKGE